MTTRWGILGAGRMAARFASDLPLTRDGRLVAVASRSLASAQAFAEAHPNVRAFDDYTALCALDEVDAIYVCTPNALHREHCVLALEAGKAVLCEKPLAASAADAVAIAEAAERTGTFCMEALWTRFLPTFEAVHHSVTSGEIGQIRQISASLGFPRQDEAGNPITDPNLGGGAHADLGIYGLSLAETLAGPGKLVSAQVSRSASGSVRDVQAILRHAVADGRTQEILTTLTVSHATNLGNVFEVAGTAGRIMIDAPFILGGSARIVTFSGDAYASTESAPSGIMRRLKMSSLWPVAKRVVKAVRPASGRSIGQVYRGTGLQFEADEVARCIAENRSESDKLPLRPSAARASLIEEISQFT